MALLLIQFLFYDIGKPIGLFVFFIWMLIVNMFIYLCFLEIHIFYQDEIFCFSYFVTNKKITLTFLTAIKRLRLLFSNVNKGRLSLYVTIRVLKIIKWRYGIWFCTIHVQRFIAKISASQKKELGMAKISAFNECWSVERVHEVLHSSLTSEENSWNSRLNLIQKNFVRLHFVTPWFIV